MTNISSRHSGFCCSNSAGLKAQSEADKDSDLPREGVGCWHPVFPARIDKEIERVVRDNPEPALTVFEQTADEDGSFTGIRRVPGTPEPL
jgi:hypothetical protein